MTYDADAETRGGHRLSSREDHHRKHGVAASPEWYVLCPDGKMRGACKFYTRESAEVFATYRMTNAACIESCRMNGCPGGTHRIERKGE